MGHRTGFSYCQLSWSPVFKLSTNYTFKNRVVHISGFKFWIVHKSGSGFLKVSLTWGTLYRDKIGSNEGVYRLKYGNYNEQKTLEIVEIPRVLAW